MRLNELTPGELTSQLKQQGIESPFGELSQEESTTIMDEFKAWYKYLRGKGFEMLGKGSFADRKSTRLNSSHSQQSRMPSSA